MNEHKAMLTLPIAPIVLTIYLFFSLNCFKNIIFAN